MADEQQQPPQNPEKLALHPVVEQQPEAEKVISYEKLSDTKTDRTYDIIAPQEAFIPKQYRVLLVILLVVIVAIVVIAAFFLFKDYVPGLLSL